MGDTPNPERFRPWVTWSLIAINVIIFLTINYPLHSKFPNGGDPRLLDYARMLASQGLSPAHIKAILHQTSLTDLFLFQYGYKPADPSITTLFASIFLHSGFMHLFGNMLFLFIYGDNVEHQLGRFNFLLMYLVTGVVATLSFALLAGHSLAPLVGASGAISGVLGFYFFMFPKNRVKMLIIFIPFYIGIVRIPARIVLSIYVLWDNLLPILLQSGGNVAYGAHLGGFFAGLIIAVSGEYLGWSLPIKRREKKIFHRTESPAKPHGKQVPTRSTITAATREGDVGKLLRALKTGTTADLKSLSPQEAIRAAQTLHQHNLPTPANRLLKVAIAANKNSPYLPEIYYELGRLRYDQGYQTAAYQHFLTALELHPADDVERKIRRMLEGIER